MNHELKIWQQYMFPNTRYCEKEFIWIPAQPDEKSKTTELSILSLCQIAKPVSWLDGTDYDGDWTPRHLIFWFFVRELSVWVVVLQTEASERCQYWMYPDDRLCTTERKGQRWWWVNRDD